MELALVYALAISLNAAARFWKLLITARPVQASENARRHRVSRGWDRRAAISPDF